MITKINAYTDSEGKAHANLEEAQKAELRIIINKYPDAADSIEVIMKEREKIIDILTMKPSSKPRARKINGGTKNRVKKSTRHEAEQFAMPFEDNSKPAA